MVFAILLAPAIFNYYAFDLQMIANSSLPSPTQTLYRATNILGFAVGSALIWFLGFPLLERVSQLIRLALASHTSLSRWLAIFYASVRSAVYLAIPGAILWAIWVVGFYYLGIGFYRISWSVGVPAHLLGALWYVPLVCRWYKLASAPAQ
jgi:hypothetical protein